MLLLQCIVLVGTLGREIHVDTTLTQTIHLDIVAQPHMVKSSSNATNIIQKWLDQSKKEPKSLTLAPKELNRTSDPNIIKQLWSVREPWTTQDRFIWPECNQLCNQSVVQVTGNIWDAYLGSQYMIYVYNRSWWPGLQKDSSFHTLHDHPSFGDICVPSIPSLQSSYLMLK